MSQNRNIAYKNLKTKKQTPSFSFQKPIISHVYYTFVFFGIIPIDKPIQIFQRSLSQVVDTCTLAFALGFVYLTHTHTLHNIFLFCFCLLLTKSVIFPNFTVLYVVSNTNTSSFTYFFLENILLFGTTN